LFFAIPHEDSLSVEEAYLYNGAAFRMKSTGIAYWGMVGIEHGKSIKGTKF
jgi:hypothetical protein